MTTNQEGVHLAVRDITGTERSYNEDWHALFDAEGITAGSFNSRMLAWINATLSASYTNVNEAMQAFAVEQGFANWASMNTFVTSLASSFLTAYGPYGTVMDFTDATIAINDATDVLDYSSQGTVSSTTGALLGPGAKLTNTAPSAKLTEQADGNIAFQAHNLALQSSNLSSATWTKSQCSVTGSQSDPDGGANAFLITEDTANAQHRVFQSFTYVQDAQYTIRFKAKSNGRNIHVRTPHGPTDVNYVLFNFSNGTTSVTGSAVTSSMTALGSGWYLCEMTAASAGGAGNFYFGLASGSTIAYIGDGTSGAYIYQPHLRRTPSVSTYVATPTVLGATTGFDLPYVYSGGVKTGIFPEPAATNLCLRSNDFTNASWTKSNMTTALTATGPDGVANSASTLTATAGNATALQAITSGSSSRLTHCYIKRRTGTGNIDLTQDNGTTWTTVTVTSAWTRVEIAAVTSTNPTVGIRIVTSGDAVDVAYFQHETGTVATSPIITYGSSVVRAVDADTSLLNLFPSLGSAYTMYIRYKPASASVATTALRLDDTTANELVSIGNNASGQGLATVTDGGAAQAAITDGTITSSAFHRLAVSVEANNVLFVVNGGTAVQDASVTLPTLTRMLLGNTSGQLITQIALFPGARTEAQLQAIGA